MLKSNLQRDRSTLFSGQGCGLMRLALLLLAALRVSSAGDVSAQDTASKTAIRLPLGVRARVWSTMAGVQIGTLAGQRDSAIVLSRGELTERCQQLAGESVATGAVGQEFFVARRRDFIDAACPIVVIPESDVTRIDISDGMQGVSDAGAGLGFLLGLAGGYVWAAQNADNTGEVIVYGTVVGAGVGLVGGLIGWVMGSVFDHEKWRRIR
ncbi:MAG: hypothetical protein HY700_01070 [Gemmatimonadetes bacterium]|nr:hypothetical protein [Gemmatimonadota bacterium]